MLAALPQEPERTRARPSLEELLLDRALWWIAEAQRERWSPDRLFACFDCASCGARFAETFRCAYSPWTGGEHAPLYTSLDELFARLAHLRTARRQDVIDADDWGTATRCACGAPSHRTSVAGAALFHSMVAGGALVVLDTETDRRCLAHTRDEGALRELDPSEEGIEQAFGRPLTLAPAWARLLAQLPPAEGQAVGTSLEPGVFLIAAHGVEASRAVAAARTEGQLHLLVFADPSTVRSRAWPASLAPLAEHLEAGVSAALVLERAVVLRQLRVLARARFDGDVVETPEGWLLRTKELAWPVSEVSVGQGMVQLGRTLPESCLLMLTLAAAAAADRLATLRAMCDLVPGTFELDGTRATGIRSDGTRGRTIELTSLPAFVSALPAEELVREAAFLLDAAPAWADRARVCPCGAASTLEARVVAWPAGGDAEARPFVLEPLEAERAAVVVALACDRHVRVPGAAELERMGLTEARILARLAHDAPLTRQRVRATLHRREGRVEVVVVEGAMVGGLVVSHGRVASLHDALGAPLHGAEALQVFALGTDRLALVDAAHPAPEQAVLDLLRAGRAERTLELVVQREIALAVERVGTFDVAKGRP